MGDKLRKALNTRTKDTIMMVNRNERGNTGTYSFDERQMESCVFTARM